MNYNDYLANANLSLSSGFYKAALDYAEKALKQKADGIEALICAGKALMSLDDSNKAVEYFKKATIISPKNGDCFFLLGYSQAMSGNTVSALNSLTKAIESGCDNALKGQIYKMLSMINTDQEDYLNALTNIEQAEGFIGLDYELLQQKAACYAFLRDYHKAIYTLNQMKLLQPRDYLAYNLAFNIFMELEIYDEALFELQRAEKFADLTMTYYNPKFRS